MYKFSTAPWHLATVLGVTLAAGSANGQPAAPAATAGFTADWRHIGNYVLDEALAGAASGPCKRVWYGAGGMLYVQSGSGRVYQTSDLESWQASSARAPVANAKAAVGSLPEPGAQTRALAGDASRVYAIGEYVYRSEDGGLHWENTSVYRGASMIGGRVADLAVAPDNRDEIVTAGVAGVFRSVDGGRSWSGLNEGLPNLPAMRLLDLPVGDQGARIALNGDSAAAWPPGNKQAWVPASNVDLVTERQLRLALSSIRGANVTAIAIAGDFIYSGMQNGEILVSADRGLSWQTFSPSEDPAGVGPVERFWVDPQDPRVALAALGATPPDPLRASGPVHVLHTINGGAFWDNFTANLPDAAAHGVAADHASGALYAATDQGVFIAYADLHALGAVQSWIPVAGLPDGAAMDVKLDAQGNLLWAAVDGYGVYAALAPHRLRDPSVVSAADMIKRAVAPGSLVSILGAQVDSVQAGGMTAPVLAANGGESQIQIPFEARGVALPLAASFAGAPVGLPSLSLAAAAPVIFVARDGSPMLLDADQGVMLDAMTAAHSGTRIQILATGLGRVTPEWPTGVPAPLENPSQVAGKVHVYLDRAPVEVTRAELAPGYVGFYLVEITVPRISNYGPAELYMDVDGASSNRVRVYIEP
ncbi:MAG: hypothetical protein ABI833_00485 [Acidobacteriota bacterium]